MTPTAPAPAEGVIDAKQMAGRVLRRMERIANPDTIEGMTLSPAEAGALLDYIAGLDDSWQSANDRADAAEAARDAEKASRDIAHDVVARIWKQLGDPSYAQLAGRSIYDMIDEIIAARDAALARALPPAVRMETVEQVEALPDVATRYLIRLKTDLRFDLWDRFSPYVWGRAHWQAPRGGLFASSFLVGAWVIPLPEIVMPSDIPTPGDAPCSE